MLNVIMLSVVMLSVVMLSAVMPSVVAPKDSLKQAWELESFLQENHSKSRRFSSSPFPGLLSRDRIHNTSFSL
jgi:hypothetical protein